MKKTLTYIFLFIVLSVMVYSNGICSLDKEQYILGDSGLFSCSCNSAQEENRAGFIVFMKNDGTVLQSAAANSGNCVTNQFSDSFVWDETDTIGWVNFSANADGTGKPAQWNGVGDINYDNYSVSNATASSCIIEFENITKGSYPLGRLAAGEMTVLDGETRNSLVHANCDLQIKQGVNGGTISLLNIPYFDESPDNHKTTHAYGKLSFQHFMGEKFWQPNKQYIMNMHCYCTPNGTDEQCYIGNSTGGGVAGFRECDFSTSFRTGEDYREGDKSLIGVVLIFAIMIGFFVLVGFAFFRLDSSEKQLFYMGLMAWFLAFIEIVFMLGVVWMVIFDKFIGTLMRLNWIIMFILFGGVGVFILIRLVMSCFVLDEDHNAKWR